ncbi:MAG: hypothetical protein ABJI96_20530 [Paracoccaceae bacterium]
MIDIFGGLMEITVTKSAAETGHLRVWLKRVPVLSETIYAIRINSDGSDGPIVAEATVFGRGEGSTASQRSMLSFRLVGGNEAQKLGSGETLRLKTRSLTEETFEECELDLLMIE